MPSLEKTVGKRFAQLRRDTGMTQAALAELCDIAPETIGRLERGEQMPSLSRLSEIAIVLGVDLGELLCRSQTRTPIDDVIDRLTALLRRRGTADAALILDVAERIFRQY